MGVGIPAHSSEESPSKRQERFRVYAAVGQNAVTEAGYLSQQGIIVPSGTTAIMLFGQTAAEKRHSSLRNRLMGSRRTSYYIEKYFV
jgi:hypothetical protein